MNARPLSKGYSLRSRQKREREPWRQRKHLLIQVMAQLENQRSLQSVLEKQTKYQNFVNTTKLNASKIYKEQQSKKIDDSNAKKIMVQKQKELKAKYTVMERKK